MTWELRLPDNINQNLPSDSDINNASKTVVLCGQILQLKGPPTLHPTKTDFLKLLCQQPTTEVRSSCYHYKIRNFQFYDGGWNEETIGENNNGISNFFIKERPGGTLKGDLPVTDQRNVLSKN